MREAALETGAWGCVISGAGPSLLALAPADRAEAVGQAMTGAWQGEGVSSHSAVLGLQEGGSTWAPLVEASRPQVIAAD